MGDAWAAASTVPGLFATGAAAVSGTGGATPNADLMRHARAALAGLWGISAVTVLVYVAVSMAYGFVPYLNLILGILVTGPIELGIHMVFLGASRGQGVKVATLFDGFRQFGAALLAYIVMNVFILLWSLLLIIPGIIASYSYAMTFFIMADNPGIGPLDAIRRSKKMMRGRRWKLFCLHCRFIGWALLAIIFTLGIGFLWLQPYINTSVARFYDDIQQPVES
jgi:uncharacterized membrane protein